MRLIDKQPSLKPQDLLVTLKIALNPERFYTFGDLANELSISTSEVHAAVKRAELSRLLMRSDVEFNVNYSSLRDFLVYGVPYSFPAINGVLTKGMPTGSSGPVLEKLFIGSEELPVVWPDPEGNTWGISLLPIYQSVPRACKLDTKLYEVLTLIDGLRAGAARERELSSELIKEYIK